MSIKPLPPLNSLVAFEASARTLSFTRAAALLCVTQGAVSRQVRQLEGYLGVSLFERDKRPLCLTAVGEAYFQQVQSALRSIAQSTQTVLNRNETEEVTVITSNAMASLWLLPRYRDFQSRYPEVRLRILAIDSLSRVRPNDGDVVLFFCREAPESMRATPLFNERVFPVCSPAYLEANPWLSDPRRLHRGRLLVLDVEEDWVNWPEWFSEFDLPGIDEHTESMYMNSYPLVMQAALNGQGVALAWENLVEDYLDSGLLVAPVDTVLSTSHRYYLLEPSQALWEKPGVACFRRWLLSLVTPAPHDQ